MKTSMFRFRAVKTCVWLALAGALIAPLAAQAQYQLRVTPNNPAYGSTTPSGTTTTGDTVPITATPTSPYAFANWEVRRGDIEFDFSTNTANNTALLLGSTNETYIIRANFAIPEYDITLIDRSPAGADGNVYLDPPGGTYSNGTEVTIEAVPDPGNAFKSYAIGSNTYTNAEITVTVDRDITVYYDFKEGEQLTLTVNSYDDNGDVIGSPVVIVNNIANNGSGDTKWDFGTVMSIEVNETDLVAPGIQLIEPTWQKDFGSGAIASGQVIVPNFTLTNKTQYTYTWTTQYLLTVDVVLPDEGGADGDVNRVPAGDPGPIEGTWWYNAGQSVDLTAVPVQGLFSQWGGDASGVNRGITITMDGPKSVQAYFAETILDNDNDGLADNWEAQFGLDSDDNTLFGNSGAFGDPDNDGVPNITEYQISYVWLTNHSVYAVSSPINADSDGDGMDDGYELGKILNQDPVADGTPVPGSQINAVAVVDPTGVYGRTGNLDEDFLWNPLTGYETTVGLVNYQEYVGPDHIVPGTWPPTLVPGLGTNVVYRYVANPLDTGDQSNSDVTDSEVQGSEVSGDGFDDGFEYTWDEWQGAHAGDPVGDPLGHRVPYREDVGVRPTALAAADFNEDGVMDLASANSGVDEVAILLGDETTNGTFRLPEVEVAVGDWPRSIAAADLNGDGTTNDLIVVNGSNDTVTVMLCAGDGTFSSLMSYPVGTMPADLVVDDFNGDGTNDIAVCNEGSGDVNILIGSGGDVFAVQPAVLIPASSPVSIDAGVLVSSNGVPDLAVANGGGITWTILANDGAGNFSFSGFVGTGVDPSCIKVRDVTDDGIDDVIVSCFGSDEIRTHVGDGVGGFSEPAGSAFSLGTGRGPRHFTVRELNSLLGELPSYPDVAVANQAVDPGLVSILFGNQGAGWSQGGTLDTEAEPSWVISADFNNDLVMDLAVAERGADSLIVFLGRDSGIFLAPTRYETSQIVGDRRFNPATIHVDPPDGGRRDYDLQYNPANAGVGDWLTDELEYNAWQNTLALMRPEFADRRRCSHPLLWDADGDRVPDGWELAFGYDPWDFDTGDTGDNDGAKNPDGDWFAATATNRHNDVYQAFGFNPTTGWWYHEPYELGPGANTVVFGNYEELIGPRGFAAIAPHDANDTGTHPFTPDTDGDGMWDGWEWYVGLDAKEASDGGLDEEPQQSVHFPTTGDEVANSAEFASYATSATNQAALVPVTNWFNKILPTDPWTQDTDNDQVMEGAERSAFNDGALAFSSGTIEFPDLPKVEFPVYANGGMIPTTADTDGDHMPDGWESEYPATSAGDGVWSGGMNATLNDMYEDPDGDGLLNYQEYMCSAIYMWQFQYNNGAPAFTPGLGLYGYEPFDFFDETLSSNGMWDVGPGGRAPYAWDAYVNAAQGVPWRFVTGAEHRPGLFYSSADPRELDTDLDDMDDYWEVYHGLNPLFGLVDIVRTKVYGSEGLVVASWTSQYNFPIPGIPDLRLYPWLSGDPRVDADQDEIPNIFESVQQNATLPDYHHTDPSPMWMTDTSSPESWVNQHYWLGTVMGNNFFGIANWYWDEDVLKGAAEPSYMFSFEEHEGFDTDNDNLPDRAEIADDPISPGVTDPLEGQSPIKRRALYLDGAAAARTMTSFMHNENDFRRFTVELWCRPENPASGADQILVERAAEYRQGNYQGAPNVWELRANFRLGIDAAGRPFVGYDGAGEAIIFEEAKAGANDALPANIWSHVAATYDGAYQQDGQWVGSLKLYVNGELKAAKPTSHIPVNGWYGGLGNNTSEYNSAWLYPMAITVGAGDDNPAGWPDQAPILVGPLTGYVKSSPDLRDPFRGWVDQVNIWNGARTASEIENSMMVRYTRADVQAAVSSYPGARYVFTFDDLPDPDHDPVAPEGFDLLNGRPAGYVSSPWWALANDSSTVYDDYRYVPWIENLAGHAATDPPQDTSLQVRNTNFLAGRNLYPNPANPYSMVYRHASRFADEHHPHVSVPFTSLSNQTAAVYLDLLPLRGAVADEDVELWDGYGTGRDPYDTDDDGMADEWETLYGLDPNSDAGELGPWGDPDHDGLINLYEYFAWLNDGIALGPFTFNSVDTNGLSDYFTPIGPGMLTFGEKYDDTDVVPDGFEEMSSTGIDRFQYHRNLDSDNDDWDSQMEYLGGTDPDNASSRPRPTVAGEIHYNGFFVNIPSLASHLHVLAYDTQTMDIFPAPAAVRQSKDNYFFEFTNRIPGQVVYLLAYYTPLDDWREYQPGDPYGVVGPIHVGIDGVQGIDIQIMDVNKQPWNTSFGWPRPEGISDVFVRLSDIDAGNKLVLTHWLHNQRNWYEGGEGTTNGFAYTLQQGTEEYWQAQDYRNGDTSPGYDFTYGLPPGNYKWQVSSNDLADPNAIFAEGIFNVPNYPAVDVEPVEPMGGTILKRQVHTFQWRGDPMHPMPRFDIQFWPTNAAWTRSVTVAMPSMDETGLYSLAMPVGEAEVDLFGGEGWPSGDYRWRVRSHNNLNPGAWSSIANFTIAPIADRADVSMISGEVLYYGKSHTSNIIVRAYYSPDDGQDRVRGQVQLPSAGDFVLTGLGNVPYRLMAFIDVNTNNVADEWEPQGIARDSSLGGNYEHRADAYALGQFDLSAVSHVFGVKILVRDRDTDDDNIPDAWEWEFLHNSPRGIAHTGFEDMDGDGLSNLQEYGLDSNPINADTDGDGLSDGEEVNVHGSSPTRADTDGDGIGDGVEVAMGLSPNSEDDDFDGVPTAVEIAWDGQAGVYETASDMNPGALDTDTDGVGDLMEIAAGSDPLRTTDSNQIFIKGLSPSGVGGTIAEWDVYRNRNSVDVRFVLQFSPDLLLWTDVSGLTSDGDTDARVSVTDGEARGKRGFYRLRLGIE